MSARKFPRGAQGSQLDLLAAMPFDARNPTNHYTLRLAAEPDRVVADALVQHARQTECESPPSSPARPTRAAHCSRTAAAHGPCRCRGGCWRNETVDGVPFEFPANGNWAVPKDGVLELDFVRPERARGVCAGMR